MYINKLVLFSCIIYILCSSLVLWSYKNKTGWGKCQLISTSNNVSVSTPLKRLVQSRKITSKEPNEKPIHNNTLTFGYANIRG